MYSVELLPSAARVVMNLEQPMRRRIATALDRLAQDARRNAVKLRGSDNVWRVRVGNHRILYEVYDDRLLILVIRIGHRRDVYG